MDSLYNRRPGPPNQGPPPQAGSGREFGNMQQHMPLQPMMGSQQPPPQGMMQNNPPPPQGMIPGSQPPPNMMGGGQAAPPGMMGGAQPPQGGMMGGGQPGPQGMMVGGQPGSQGMVGGGQPGSQGMMGGGQPGPQGMMGGSQPGPQGMMGGGQPGPQGMMGGAQPGPQGMMGGGQPGPQGMMGGGQPGPPGMMGGGQGPPPGMMGGTQPPPGMMASLPQELMFPFPMGPGQAPGSFPLKVEDALSYLDKVKLQFGDQPQVYNQFLDIMKEFKSQSIDTPGVIHRVSTLFEGHPDLIVGFNTFLPLGYKIDYHGHVLAGQGPPPPQQPPPGVTLQPMLLAMGLPAAHHPATPQPMSPGPVSAQQMQQQGPPQPPHSAPPQGGPATPRHMMGQPSMMPPGPPPPPPPMQNPHNRGIGGGGPMPAPQGPPTTAQGAKPPVVEFNHAINYVNKIKTRFAQQPDTYKAFLEILHTYQKEQRTIKEVYTQVAQLFKAHHDLLEEFAQFLPEAAPHHAQAMAPQNQMNQLLLQQQQQQAQQNYGMRGTGYGGGAFTALQNAGMEMAAKREAPDERAPQPGPPQPPAKKARLGEGEYIPSNEEIAFFDRVRAALGGGVVYDNFVRCLNLFTAEILGPDELLGAVKGFLARQPELLVTLKALLGFGAMPAEGHLLDGAVGLHLDPSEVDLSVAKRYGYSYRKLPQRYTLIRCTGRTPEDAVVLNDEWVLYPVNADSDSYFVPHKKNVNDETLFKTEDQRYELDMVLEANDSTLRALESLEAHLKAGGDDSPPAIDQRLGTAPSSTHYRALQRLYGERVTEVVMGLRANPHAAVPVVLRRVRQKQEDWRRAQKDINRQCSDTQARCMLKALDYQAVAFKNGERKALSSRQLVGEVQARHDEGAGGVVVGLGCDLVMDAVQSMLLSSLRRVLPIEREATDVRWALAELLPAFYGQNPIQPQQAPAEDGKDAPTEDSTPAQAEQVEGEPKAEARPAASKSRDLPRFFVTNENWFMFFRLHLVLVERMQRLWLLAESAKTHPPYTARDYREPKKDTSNLFADFLRMAKRFLENNIDQNTYEDFLRENFGVEAYFTYTLDRLVAMALRQASTCYSDAPGRELSRLYATELQRTGDTAGHNDPSVYAGVTWDGPRFTVAYDHKRRQVALGLLEGGGTGADTGAYQRYLTAYVRPGPTSPRLADALSRGPRVFLSRTRQEGGEEGGFEVENGLECRICMATYARAYVPGTADYFFRCKLHPPTLEDDTRRQRLMHFVREWRQSQGVFLPDPAQARSHAPPPAHMQTMQREVQADAVKSEPTAQEHTVNEGTDTHMPDAPSST